MTHTHPFDSSSELIAYIKDGGDIDIMYGEKTLTDYFLIDELNSNRIIEFLCYANINKNHPELQNKLYQCLKYKLDGDCNFIPNKKSFIQHFDLLHPTRFNNETNCGLYYLCNQQGLTPLFFHAEQYHPQFKEAVKIRNHFRANLWHTIVNYIVYSHLNAPEEKNYFKILDSLFLHFPEGLSHKNMYGETPFELAYKGCGGSIVRDYNINPKFGRLIQTLSYFTLDATLNTDKLKIPTSKI